MKKIILVLCLACYTGFAVDITTENKQTIKVYEKDCEEGIMEKCVRLGAIYADGALGIEKDGLKAIKYLQKACDNNFYSGCFTLGLVYAKGISGEQDYPSAIEFFKKACKGGEPISCAELGRVYYLGVKGVELDIDLEKGAAYFREACRLSFWRGCLSYGLHEEGTLKNTKEAMKYYKKACDLGKNNIYVQNDSKSKEDWLFGCDRYKILK